MRKKLLSLVLALAMLVSLAAVPAGASGAAGNWYDGAMSAWAERGVIQGDANGDLNPTGNITRAELAVILSRIMGYRVSAPNTYADVQDGAWYADAVLKATAAGVLQGDGVNARPGDTITRQEATVMLSRVLGLDAASAPSGGFTDQAAVAAWAEGAVNAMAARGYVKGSGGAFRPAAAITRAEVLTILGNMFPGYFDRPGAYTDNVDGSAVITTGGVTLSNLRVSGDLVVAEGVGDGHIELDGVTVGGRLIVRGGGEDSIIIKGGSQVGQVVVSRQDGKVRVSVQGGADVEIIYVDDGCDDVRVEGSVKSVTVAAPGVSVEIAGEVETVELTGAAEGASLTVEEDAKVGAVTTAAGDSTVSVAGRVETLTAAEGAQGATLAVEPTAEVDTVSVSGSRAQVTVAGSVETLETTSAASGAAVTVSKDAKVDTVSVSSQGADVSVAGTVGTVEVTGGASGTTISTEKGAKVESVKTSGADTTVQGDGKVEKVEAGKDASGTTVNTNGTKVENNSSEKVTSGSGSIDPGKTGTSQGDSSKPSTGSGSTGGGSTSTGGGSTTHSHRYTDGKCSCGAYDPAWAQVSSAETWTAAVTAEKNIILTASFTADAQLVLDKALTVNGDNKTITRTNKAATAATTAPEAGGILVMADNAAIKNLTVSGPNSSSSGWDNGEYGIKVYNAKGVTLNNITVTAANAGIQVNSATVTLGGTITLNDNEFGGIEVCKSKDDGTYAGELTIGSANIVSTSKTLPAIWIDGTGSDAGVVKGADKLYTYTHTKDNKSQLYYFTDLPEAATATIDKVCYSTLQDAFTAAQSNDTIVVQKDITNIAPTAPIAITKAITLDGNGKKLTASSTSAATDGAGWKSATAAVLSVTGASATVKDLTINGNSAARGVFVTNGTATSAITVTLDGVTVTDCKVTGDTAKSAVGAGAGVRATRTVNKVDGKDVGNSKPINLIIEDCTISGNTATSSGGGISFDNINGCLTVNGGNITGNTGGYYAGGVWVASTADMKVELNGPTITGNKLSDGATGTDCCKKDSGQDLFINSNEYGEGGCTINGGTFGSIHVEGDSNGSKLTVTGAATIANAHGLDGKENEASKSKLTIENGGADATINNQKMAAGDYVWTKSDDTWNWALKTETTNVVPADNNNDNNPTE